MDTRSSRTSFDVRTERLNLIETRSRADQSSLASEQPADGSEVEDWIKSVRALKERRKAEDEARNRQLEEDILRERKARQERRMTRGRSLSPTKNTPDPGRILNVDRLESASVEGRKSFQTSSDRLGSPQLVSQNVHDSHVAGSPVEMPSTKLSPPQKSEPALQTQSKHTPAKSDLTPTRTTKNTVLQPSKDPPQVSKKPTLGAERNLRSDQLDYSSLNSRMSRLMVQTPRSPDPTSETSAEEVLKSSKSIFEKANSLPASPVVRQVQSTPPVRRPGFDAVAEKPNLFDVRASLRSTKTNNRSIEDQVKETLLTAKTGLKSSNDKPTTAAKTGISVSPSPSSLETGVTSTLSQKLLGAKPVDPLPAAGTKTEATSSGSPQLPTRSSTIPLTGKETSKPSIFSRHDPRLASLLARGPPSAPAAKMSNPSSNAEPRSANNNGGEKLQHLTKGRARRPKQGSKAMATNTQISTNKSNSSSSLSEVTTKKPPPTTPLKVIEPQRASNLENRSSAMTPIAKDGVYKVSQELPHLRSGNGNKQLDDVTPSGHVSVERQSLTSASLSSPKSPFTGRSPSPFKRDSVLRHSPSKSVTGMTAVADLIRGRADSMARHKAPEEKLSGLLPSAGNGNVLRAWKVSTDGTHEIDGSDYRNIITPKAIILIQDSKQKLSYQWIGSECESENIEQIKQIKDGEVKKVYMGEETTEFMALFQSRTVITQDEASSDPSAKLFAVRKYLDGFAADQVPLQASSLCSGFVYLLSTKKESQIWKGRGSFTSELDAAKDTARLLQPSADMIIVEEGSEPQSFWTLMGGQARYASSSYWKLKKDFPAYAVDLYTIERAKAVRHKVWSFQSLLARKVHIIDCFFEIYIYLWAENSKADIKCAIQWCKDFCKRLGQSRPFIPMALVLCPNSKLPRDLAAIFRTPVANGKELRILEIDTAETILQRKTFRYTELRTGNIVGCDLATLDECIDPRDFTVAMGISRQEFQRLSSAEQNDYRQKARAALASA